MIGCASGVLLLFGIAGPPFLGIASERWRVRPLWSQSSLHVLSVHGGGGSAAGAKAALVLALIVAAAAIFLGVMTVTTGALGRVFLPLALAAGFALLLFVGFAFKWHWDLIKNLYGTGEVVWLLAAVAMAVAGVIALSSGAVQPVRAVAPAPPAPFQSPPPAPVPAPQWQAPAVAVPMVATAAVPPIAAAPEPGARPCPFCAESIRVEAKVCPFCHRVVAPGGLA